MGEGEETVLKVVFGEGAGVGEVVPCPNTKFEGVWEGGETWVVGRAGCT